MTTVSENTRVGKIDPATPGWVLDVAEDVMRYRVDRLLAVMLDRDENISDAVLYRHRLSQLDSILASGKVRQGP